MFPLPDASKPDELASHRGSISLRLSHFSFAIPVWIFFFDQWRRFFGSDGSDDSTDSDSFNSNTNIKSSTKNIVLDPTGKSTSPSAEPISTVSSSIETAFDSKSVNSQVHDEDESKSSFSKFFSSFSSSPTSAHSWIADFDLDEALASIERLSKLPAYQSPILRPSSRSAWEMLTPFIVDLKHRLKIQCMLNASLLVDHQSQNGLSHTASALSSDSVNSESVTPSGRALSTQSPAGDERLSAKIRLSTQGRDDFFQIEFAFHLHDLMNDVESMIQGQSFGG
jgi:hypothetical protein